MSLIRAASLAALVTAAVALAAPAESAARRTRGPQPGDIVGVKVRGDAVSGFVAREVERREGDDDEELRGRLEAGAAGTGTWRVLGVDVAVPPDVRIEREPGAPAGVDRPIVGLRVQVDVRRAAAGLEARAIKIRADQDYDERRIVGLIQDVRWARGRPSSLVVLGLEVEIAASTEFLGYPEMWTPSLLRDGTSGTDDDDLRVLGGARGGRIVFGGELRARVEAFDNEDGDEATDDREVEGKLSALLGMAASLGPVSAYVKVDAEREYFLESTDPFAEGQSEVRLDEAYIEAAGLGTPHLTWVVGRQKFDEEREWWYRTTNLDAVRLLGRWRRASGEVSWSRTVFDRERFPEDADKRNLLAVVRWEPDADLVVEGRWLRREDATGGDDSPTTAGVRVAGEIARRLAYRADIVQQSGTRERIDPESGNRSVREIEAEAIDARVTFRPRVALDPTFTVGYARGSGDATADLDPDAQPGDADRSFRQSGLQRNRGKDHGTVSYRYYGEVLDPELTNLRIMTVAVGIRPRRSVSLDVLHHRYRQDVASPRLRFVDIDADPNGEDPDLGDEFDLAFGYEPSRALEIRLTAGLFRPGRAFADEVGDSASVRLQVKFRF